MIKPIFTEKSLAKAKLGQYSFWVGLNDTKTSLKSIVSKLFGVHVVEIKTSIVKSEKGKNARGRKFAKKAMKKATVILKKGEKIDIYEKS